MLTLTSPPDLNRSVLATLRGLQGCLPGGQTPRKHCERHIISQVAAPQAFKARKKGGRPPKQALRFVKQLYRVERQADCIPRFRKQHSVPVLNNLKQWLNEIGRNVLPDSQLGDAISVTLNQWEYPTRFTEDGRMPSDLLEREIRIFATGRKAGCSAIPSMEPKPSLSSTA